MSLLLALLIAFQQSEELDKVLDAVERNPEDGHARKQALELFDKWTDAQLEELAGMRDGAALKARIVMRRRLGREVVEALPKADFALVTQKPTEVRELLSDAGKLPVTVGRRIVDVLKADLLSADFLVMAAPGAPAAYWDHVRDLMPHEEPLVRDVAIDVLGESGIASYGDDLAKLLKQPDPRVRVRLLRSIRALRARSTAASVVECLDDASPLVKAAAIDCLCTFRAAGEVQRLVPLLKDADAKTRLKALEGMAELGAKDLLDAALGRLGDEDAAVRMRALELVGDKGAAAHRARVKALLEDPDDAVKARAGLALARLGGTGHEEKLAALLEKQGARADAIEALGLLDCRDYEIDMVNQPASSVSERRALMRYFAATDAFVQAQRIPDLAAAAEGELYAEMRAALAGLSMGREMDMTTRLAGATMPRDVAEALVERKLDQILALPQGVYNRRWDAGPVRTSGRQWLIAAETAAEANVQAEKKEAAIRVLSKTAAGGDEDTALHARIGLLRLGVGDASAAARLIEDAKAADVTVLVRVHLLNIVARRFLKIGEALEKPVAVENPVNTMKDVIGLLDSAGLRLHVDADRPLACRTKTKYTATARGIALCYLGLTGEKVLHADDDGLRVMTLSESEDAWVRKLRKP